MYIFIVISILAILIVLAYYLFLKEKKEKLFFIEKGVCPECKDKTIKIKKSKNGGCSGVSNIIYKCENCGYEEEFNLSKESSCGIL